MGIGVAGLRKGAAGLQRQLALLLATHRRKMHIQTCKLTLASRIFQMNFGLLVKFYEA